VAGGVCEVAVASLAQPRSADVEMVSDETRMSAGERVAVVE
jgi:hypothetical protein